MNFILTKNPNLKKKMGVGGGGGLGGLLNSFDKEWPM